MQSWRMVKFFFHIADYRQANDELALNESLADFK